MSTSVERLSPWALRVLWLVTGLTIAAAVDGLGLNGVVRGVLGVGWVVGVIAMAVPAVSSLTAVRAVVPLAVPAAIAASIGGADQVAVIIGSAVLATVVACSADLGRAFVQASAYGAEDRHLLRPPAAYLAAAVLAWSVMAGLSTVGVSLLASENWIPGIALLVGGVGFGAWSIPRWHRLARRWLVVVPIGIVVHDQLVLGETLMLRRHEVAGIWLAPAGTDAADLTGPAGGHALEIATVQPVTVVLAGTPKRPGGSAIHLTACLVAPTRPGRALAAAMRR